MHHAKNLKYPNTTDIVSYNTLEHIMINLKKQLMIQLSSINITIVYMPYLI